MPNLNLRPDLSYNQALLEAVAQYIKEEVKEKVEQELNKREEDRPTSGYEEPAIWVAAQDAIKAFQEEIITKEEARKLLGIKDSE